jgi:O-antigen/teichoic acid export membrane protein
MAVALAKGAGVWAFPISATAGFLASFPPAFVIIRRRQPGFRLIAWKIDEDFWRHFHKFKRDAWSSFRTQLSIMFLFTMDTNLISWMTDNKQQIGAFCNLSRILERVRMCLATMSEVVWPMIAQKTHDTARLTRLLPRLNSWVYGGAMGAVCATIGPFIASYMSSDWSTPVVWVFLLAIRFTIIGASSPACYFLIGLGEFKVISRIIERELMVAVILGAALGYAFGVKGVLAGFLISTAAGTLFSLFSAYAKAAKKGNPWPLAWETWWRAALAFAAGLLIALGLIRVLGGGLRLIPIGMIAAGLPVALASLPAALRWWRARRGFALDNRASAATIHHPNE